MKAKTYTLKGGPFKGRVVKYPTMRQLEFWAFDSVCEALDDCQVEPDGRCEHNYPSWLSFLGYI